MEDALFHRADVSPDTPLHVADDREPIPDLAPLFDPERLDHLRRLDLRTSPPRTALERLCRLAAQVLDADAASVTIVEDVQTTVAEHQLNLPADSVTVTLDESFCARAMVTEQTLAIPDAGAHPWVKHTVAARTGRVVGYLSVPLVLSDGHSLGALCVFSDAPRQWTTRDERLLTDLAASTSTELELRVSATDLASSLADTQAARENLEHAATHDALTGLANRVLLARSLTRGLAARGGLALCYLDLDGFKPVNDTYGHATGDELLVLVAQRLTGVVDRDAVVARLGGDEFAVLIHDDRPQVALMVAERLRAVLSEPFELGGRSLTVGASVGVVTTELLGGHDITGDDLLVAADAAMFHAKDARDGRVHLYGEGLRAQHRRRRRVREAVAAALGDRRLQLLLEPEIDLTGSGEVVGLKVAPRLRGSGVVELTSGEVIEAAQELGVLAELDGVLCERVSELRRAWRDAELPTLPALWVHATANQLVDATFRHRLLSQGQDPGTVLGVGVTEEVLAAPRSVELLEHLQAGGIRVAIEGFGSGHASFAALHSVRFDLLRLDPALTTRLDEDRTQQRVVSSIRALAGNLDVTVVATGVASAGVLAAARDLGCGRATGPVVSLPLTDGPELRALLRHGAERTSAA